MKRANTESPEPSSTTLSHSDAKRMRIGDQEIEEFTYSLLNLSDDVLLNIFKHLSSFDLMTLSL